MLYTKDGFPEVNEVVLCTVTKIYGNTVFVGLDEYEKEGVLTISEIAPGRIRNLRDHVVENKKIVCKVLRVDEKNNRVDVSLRRVSIPVMKEKQEQIKKEEYSDRIYEEVSKKLGITKDDLFEKTYEPIFEEYETVFECLYDIMLKTKDISMFTNLSVKEQETFLEVVNQRIKPEEIIFKKKISLYSLAENGIDVVKESIKQALEEVNYQKVSIYYLAAGEYGINIIHEDVKSADKLYSKLTNNIENFAKTNKLVFEFEE